MGDNVVSSIYKTTDYSKFHLIKGNRIINEKHIDGIVKSMKRKVLLIPIHVDNTFGIIDGQHRFEAYKRLNIPVPYVVDDSCSIYDIADMNIGSPWSDMDFVNFYSEQGNSNYRLIMNLKEYYPILKSPKLYIAIASGSPKGVNNKKIRDGSFKFYDWNKAMMMCARLMDFEICGKMGGVHKKHSPWGQYYFFLSLYKLISMPGYDHNHMIQRVEKYPTNIVRNTNVKGYLNNMFDLYNRNNSKKLSLDLIG